VLPFSRNVFARVSVLTLRYEGEESGAIRKEGVVPSFRCALSLRFAFVGWAKARSAVPTLYFLQPPRGLRLRSTHPTKKKKGNGTPTDAVVQPAVLLARPRLQQKAHAYRRPTAALPWRLSLPRCNFRPCFRGLGLAPIL